jgi:hypothetical protein
MMRKKEDQCEKGKRKKRARKEGRLAQGMVGSNTNHAEES